MVLGLFGSKVDMKVAVDRPSAPYDGGDPIHVTVTIRGKDVKAEEIRLTLFRHEHYQYQTETEDSEGNTSLTTYWTDDMHEIAREVLAKGGLEGPEETFTVDWQLPPDATPTYQGRITQVQWLVRATIDRKMRGDIHAEAGLVVRARKPNVLVKAGEYGKQQAPEDVELRFWLPGLEWGEGETVAGKLLVRPVKDLGVNEVRVELVRIEQVPCDEGNEHQAIADTARVAAKTDFQAGAVVEYPFQVAVPRAVCPTFVSENSSATWRLRGVLARRLRSDYAVEQEIHVHNETAS